ncbi:MAG: serine/threonine-protein phosphatase [Chloroflexi bacterium]|nr:serine/threonine-protein phosphatase [Chloroflexota bacterium]
MKLTVGFRTDKGPREGPNEDVVFATIPADNPNAAILIASDGVGGAKAGDHASRTAVDIIREYLLERPFPQRDEVIERLREALQAANEEVYTQSQANAHLRGMACTVVMSLVIDNMFWVAHVGDSRAYLIADEEVSQLTLDHTLGNSSKHRNLAAIQQVKAMGLDKVLDRAIGIEPNVAIDVRDPDVLASGDIILLSTDGLHEVVSEMDMLTITMDHPAEQAAERLVKAALDAPARDNVSVVILKTD